MHQDHKTVLLNEAVESLKIRPEGLYIDATFGRGGHSQKILQHLKDGQLLVIDRDPQALDSARTLAKNDSRVLVEEGPFENLLSMIKNTFDSKVDGILFDLGVSSPQLDQAHRGFSFMHNGPLDMRMDTTGGMTAAEWLNTSEWKDMSRVFWRFGEEKNATRIAKEIVLYRESTGPFETTGQLVELISRINRKEKKHPATRVFQAIRIHINRELEQIERVLPQAVDSLNTGGRLVVISFHSLEDRIVKNFIKSQIRPQRFDKRMPIEVDTPTPIKNVCKPIKASAAEIEANPRSRSAIMRVIEKL